MVTRCLMFLCLIAACGCATAPEVQKAPDKDAQKTVIAPEAPTGPAIEVGRAAFERGDMKTASSAFRKVIKAYEDSGEPPGSPKATLAAEAAFHLAEIKWSSWSKIALKGKLKEQEKSLKAKLTGAENLKLAYQSVYQYRSEPWIIAAGVREALVLRDFAATLIDAEIPFPEGSEEHDIYGQTLFDLALPLEDKAATQLGKVLERAREKKIESVWTRKGGEALKAIEARKQ